MTTVKTKVLSDAEARAAVALFTNSGMFAQMRAKERAERAARRRAVSGQLKADQPLLEREYASAIKQRDKASGVMVAADQALTDAKGAYREAYFAVTQASFNFERARQQAEQKMRADADPRIAVLHEHLSDLRDRSRKAFHAAYFPDGGFGRPSRVETNTAAVVNSVEAIKALIAEVESLPLEDFSDDVGPRLASIAAKAAEAARAVGLHAEWELPL
jgi:hypothetical protein